MMRYIACPQCRNRMEPHPEDVADGWLMRTVDIPHVKKPENHQIEIRAGNEPVSIIPVPMVVCDFCNDEIPEGTLAVGVTMWRSTEEDTPGNWEKDFGGG